MRIGAYIHRMMIVIALSAAAAIASCSRDDAGAVQPVGTSDAEVQVGFRIVLGEVMDGTRSGGYDDGTGTDYENAIGILDNDYCVMFFDTANRYITTFRPTELVPVDDNYARSRYYDAIGRIDKPLPSSFRVVIMANWGKYPADAVAGTTTIDDICTSLDSRYSYDYTFRLSADCRIPMYGVKLCTGMTFKSDLLTYLGTVCMLRAMAKIEVTCDSEDWTVESVMLNRYNSVGFCAPLNVYEEQDYVKGSYDDDYTDDIHIVDGAERDDRLYFSRTEDGRYVIYLPEYRNTRQGTVKSSKASEICVRFAERQDKEYVIDFKYYENPLKGYSVGDYFDIRRNYYYKFAINKLSEYDDGMDISLDVRQYDDYDLRPVFGLD